MSLIQCKFYTHSISKRDLATINIPSLIHEYGANGYLLVCKNGVTSNVSTMFENFRRNCRLGYTYEIWTGADFLRKIRSNDEILASFFFNLLQNEKGNELERVYNEWQYALKCETPALLLVEDTTSIDNFPMINRHPDVIRFNRSSKASLNKTIQMVRAKSDAASNRTENSPFVRETAWFIGGPVAINFLNIL